MPAGISKLNTYLLLSVYYHLQLGDSSVKTEKDQSALQTYHLPTGLSAHADCEITERIGELEWEYAVASRNINDTLRDIDEGDDSDDDDNPTPITFDLTWIQ